MRGPSLTGPGSGRLVLDVLRAGGSVRLAAGGHSMAPTIRSGDRLTIEPPRGAPRTGEVLACDLDGRLVIHRMVGRLEGRIEVRGDVAPASDRLLESEEVLGTVVRVERGGRRILLGLGWERVLIVWLSRLGLLRLAARWVEMIRKVPLGSENRLPLSVSERAQGARP